MFESILVCLDGSKLSEQVLPYVSEMAARFDSKVVYLQVTTLLPGVTVGTESGATATVVEASRVEEEKAREYLDQLALQLTRRGIYVVAITMRGTPEEAIVDYADKNDIGLIAITTHGRSGVGRAFYGSVADYVVRNAARPVLVIRPFSVE